MNITASMVKELRERTGAGMMECKKALQTTDGDIDLAIENLRKIGLAKADKKASRIAAEGMIAIATNEQADKAVMLEVNSETDFVAKADEFKEFAAKAAGAVLDSDIQDIDGLNNFELDGKTIEQNRQELIAKLGENVSVRRFAKIAVGDVVGSYSHGGKIGVLVGLKGGNDELAKDIAMHIAASKPLALDESGVPAEILKKEREIFVAQAKESGKPDAIIEKMIDGKIKKFISEIILLGQSFVKAPDKTVGKLLTESKAEVLEFSRLEVGEGIEKKPENFADEVMAQIK